MGSNARGIFAFDLEKGRLLARKYVVGEMLGKGWEGEVYHVTEASTGIERAAKVFYPKRNPGNAAMMTYAKKLDRLRDCPVIIQYHNQDTFRFQGETITFLVSEYVKGDILAEFVRQQPGKRMQPFEALHLLYSLATGIEQIHRAGEYHGDLHAENILINRRGLGFDVALLDFYDWGRRRRVHVEDDVCGLIRIFYDALGGAKHYAKQPAYVKGIVLGLKKSLIVKKFRNAKRLCEYLETMPWT